MAIYLLSYNGLFMRGHSCFVSLGMIMVYNCSNTCLYILWRTLILISCLASLSSLCLCLMSSLLKGESMCTKLVELLLIGWLREETWGRACIESVKGSLIQGGLSLWVWALLCFFFILAFFVSFVGFAAFPCSRWPSWAFLWLSVFYLWFMESWIRNSNFVLFVVIVIIKEEIEKPSG
jgi:hypothetical protein